MSNMRKIINLFEDVKEDLEESWLSDTLTKIQAGLGDAESQGKLDKNNLAKTLKDNFNRWIGRTNRDGTLEDIQTFLQKVGFKNNEINDFTQTTINLITQYIEKNKNIQKDDIKPSDFKINPKEINDIMDKASAFAFNNEFNILGNNQKQSANSSNNEKQQSDNSSNNNDGQQKQSTTNILNFNTNMIDSLKYNSVNQGDVNNLTYDSKHVKFDRFDNEAKEKLAAIGYALLRYSKGINIQ